MLAGKDYPKRLPPSQPDLTFRIWGAFRRGRGEVCDLVMGVDRVNPLIPTLGELLLDIPF
jgi:hypothetical protein